MTTGETDKERRAGVGGGDREFTVLVGTCLVEDTYRVVGEFDSLEEAEECALSQPLHGKWKWGEREETGGGPIWWSTSGDVWVRVISKPALRATNERYLENNIQHMVEALKEMPEKHRVAVLSRLGVYCGSNKQTDNGYEQPLGPDDATIQIAYCTREELELSPGDGTLKALLTVRAKDLDLTEEQIRELGHACLRIADQMKKDT